MPDRPAYARRPVFAAAAALLVALALLSRRYGYHRDELYFALLPPRWGYVDQPPLVPLVAHALSALSPDLTVLRLPAMACAVGAVLIVAALTRELGGGALAQGLAAWGYAFGSMTLSFGHLFLTSSVDLVVWTAVLYCVVRVLVRADPRWWLAAGAVVGVSTYAKWLVVMLVVGVLVGLLTVGPRRPLASRWLLAGAGTAVVLALPNIVFQVRHGLPQLAMGGALAQKNAADVRISTLWMLTVMISPVLFAVVVAGVVGLLRSPALRPARFLAPTLLVVVALTVLGGTQNYYPYGALAAVFAAGCVQTAGWAARRRWRRTLLVALLVVHVAADVVISLPLLPVRTMAHTVIPDLNASVGDTVGWPAYEHQVDAVVAPALAGDPGSVLLTSNYGEAGAYARFGATRAPVFSAHNALWDLGRPPDGTRTVVVVGGQLDQVQTFFSSCAIRARLDNGVGLDNEEQGEPVAVCTGPRQPWGTIWPALRHLS